MTSKGKTYLNKVETDRLQYSLNKVIEYRKNDNKGTVSIPLEDSLSIDEIKYIEQSYFELHESDNNSGCVCGNVCEECVRYCSSQCVRLLIHIGGVRIGNGLGDEWCDELLNSEGESIDDYLESKRNWDKDLR